MMPGVNYVIYGCSFVRTTPVVLLYQSLTLEENIVAVITQDRVIDENLKRKIKNQTLCIIDYCYLPKFFIILALDQNYFSFYAIAIFSTVNNSSVD